MSMESADLLEAACERVGRYLYFFSRVEKQLDEAIAKLFKLDPQIAPIITVNLDFVRKLNIVRCAVQYQNENTERKIIEVVDFGKVLAENDRRQIIVHCSFEPEGLEVVQFRRSTARDKFKTADPRWTKQHFEQHYLTLKGLEVALQKMIGQLEPERIVWPQLSATASGLPAYLVPFTNSGWLVQHLPQQYPPQPKEESPSKGP